MSRVEALRAIREHQAEIAALGSWHGALFGSTACDEAGPASGIDLHVEVGPPSGYVALVRAKTRLEELLAHPFDRMTTGSPKPPLLARVEQDASDAVRAT